jgi:hypothetical protein
LLHDTIRFIEAKGKNEMNDTQLETAIQEVEETVCQVIQLMSKK